MTTDDLAWHCLFRNKVPFCWWRHNYTMLVIHVQTYLSFCMLANHFHSECCCIGHCWNVVSLLLTWNVFLYDFNWKANFDFQYFRLFSMICMCNQHVFLWHRVGVTIHSRWFGWMTHHRVCPFLFHLLYAEVTLRDHFSVVWPTVRPSVRPSICPSACPYVTHFPSRHTFSVQLQ